MFKIIDGSFPVQEARYEPSAGQGQGGLLVLKDRRDELQTIDLSQFVMAGSTLAFGKTTPRIKLNFTDGKTVTADVDASTLATLEAMSSWVHGRASPTTTSPTPPVDYLQQSGGHRIIVLVLAGLAFLGLFTNVFQSSSSRPQPPAAPTQAQSPAMASASTPPSVNSKAAASQAQTEVERRLAEIYNQINLVRLSDEQIRDGTVNFGQLGVIDGFLEIIDNTASAIGAASAVKNDLSAKDRKVLASAKAKLSAFQVRYLPKMRAAYRKLSATKLWDRDITVSLSRAGNTTISFYGYWFAANANIRLVHDQLSGEVAHLRFQKVQFASFSGAPQGTAYGTDAPSDAVVAVYSNGFQKAD